MAHYAKIEDGKVTEVIVADEDFISTLPGEWIQTSYNTRMGIHYGTDGQPDEQLALRGNYACTGYVYDVERDAFYPPAPFESWTFNETTFIWNSPTPCPGDILDYKWNEETLSWVEVVS
jgi:hypothetical protein